MRDQGENSSKSDGASAAKKTQNYTLSFHSNEEHTTGAMFVNLLTCKIEQHLTYNKVIHRVKSEIYYKHISEGGHVSIYEEEDAAERHSALPYLRHLRRECDNMIEVEDCWYDRSKSFDIILPFYYNNLLTDAIA